MPRSSKPQAKRQAGQHQPSGGGRQPQQQIARPTLMGPGGDPVEGRRDVGPPPKK